MNDHLDVDADDLAHCTGMVREQAPDYYLADLLLNEEKRHAALVLHAFHVEVTNITMATNEPIAGEIRLQWWSDVLEGERASEAKGNPLARALLAVMDQNNWPVLALQNKLEAHIFDLYRNPMESRTMLEGWCGETRSVMFRLVAMIDDSEANPELADGCGHAGVAMGIAGILENTVLHRSKGQVFVPTDILAGAGLSTEAYLAESSEPTLKAYEGMIALAREHLDAAIAKIAGLDEKNRSTFLPLHLVPVYLTRAQRNLGSISTGLTPLPQWRKQWALWRAR